MKFPFASPAAFSLLLASLSAAAADQPKPNLPAVKTPAFRADTLSILKFGAVADGLTKTTAIQQAIDAAGKAGGGVVLVPRGHWLTAPIEMRSNVNLHLAKGALVQFSKERADYHLIKTSWEGVAAVRNQAQIYGKDLENIAITGKGVFDGDGGTWRSVKKNKLTETQWKRLVEGGGVTNEKKDTWYPSASSLKGSTIPEAFYLKPGKDVKDYEEIKDFLRPDMLVLDHCKRLLLEGVTFQNSPAWSLHPLMSEDITVRNVTVLNPEYGQNTDAIDLESCKNGIVEGCTFDVGDDGICIKSGRDEQGRQRGMPTENFIIRDTKVYHAHGGFVIGSEMSGGARNIYAYDLTFMGTDVGLRFKAARGRGGVVENIFINNVDMKDIVGQAVIFDLYYMAKDPVPLAGESTAPPVIKAEPLGEGTPQFRRIDIKNITCNGAETGIMMRGLPEMPLRDISIENAVLQSKKGLVCIEAENIRLKNVTLLSKDTMPVMEIQNSKDISLDGIRYTPGAELLMRVTGDRAKNVKLVGTDTKAAKKDLEFGDKVSKKTVTISKL
ncbi:glycoside hydrolase family 28 protein [Hymenobacter metallicola]|uniref:Glycoside hydrolase family 28 protein n=1 Tax=Hymenobacter metallicola TaxID=2563114 RepID=A0A4Z0QEU5_9BACT|nr:glycoside hydrolase family 28 protein [Hymenobacter metallicola]TGE28275.1 glycoside hydrolase family 28 protein [Hymenobacter metallicola]